MGDLRKEFFIMDKAQNSVPYLFVVSLRYLDYRVPAGGDVVLMSEVMHALRG